jgi:hypothetical protein
VSLNDALEVHPFVGPVAKGLRFGVSAAAKADLRAATEAKNLAILIDDFEVALDSNRSIVANCDLCTSHPILRCDFADDLRDCQPTLRLC